jgi:hypothetical protein
MNPATRVERFCQLNHYRSLDCAVIYTLIDNGVSAMRARGLTGVWDNTRSFLDWSGLYANQVGSRSILAIIYSILMDLHHHNIPLSEVLVEDPTEWHNAVESGALSVYYAMYPPIFTDDPRFLQ